MKLPGNTDGAPLNTYSRLFLSAGGITAFTSVAMGALGTHAIQNTISPAYLLIYQTAVQYHFYHALGLLALGVTAIFITDSRLLILSGVLMIAGILLFSGSLYVISLTGTNGLGLLTPFGGAALLGSWALYSAAVIRHPRQRNGILNPDKVSGD